MGGPDILIGGQVMKHIIVTGSAGLIGSEAVRHYDALGWRVVGVDNNMRRTFFGSDGDTAWQRELLERDCRAYRHASIDIRDREAVLDLVSEVRPSAIIHCAAQPSHDLAAQIPFDDFAVNALGTLNLLEAARRFAAEAPFIFTSTNKVYGDGPNSVALVELETRYEFADPAYADGIPETFSIDQTKHSLFGASKVAADVMVQEYGRYFGMNTVCFRGGCLTGAGHSGAQLHGYLSYVFKAAAEARPYTIFGYKGKQVRDQIHSRDVIGAFDAFLANPRAGAVYNLGGGKANSVSILEFDRPDPRPHGTRSHLDAQRSQPDRRPHRLLYRPRAVPERLPGVGAHDVDRRHLRGIRPHQLRRQVRRMTTVPISLDPTGPGAMPVAPPATQASRHRESRAGAGSPIRVRTGHSYHVYFSIALGQRNARFVERAMTPLNRYFAWADSVSFIPEPGFEAIHAWNAIPMLTRRPYVVTFEDYLPRTPPDRRIGWLERRLRDGLLGPRCRAIIAISEYALRQFREQHAGFPRLPELLAKTELVYPAVAPRTSRPKAHSDRLKLLFVGRDFMRKGGPVLLRAHRRLREAGIPVETTIVSSLGWSRKDYVGPPDADYVRRELRGVAQDGIVHHRSLPAAAVYELMDASDYLVFPTFHDTFGFVSIEAFASGTPVIATDTCVLPEVVEPGRNGFLLPFDNDAVVGKWSWLYRQKEPGYLAAYESQTSRLALALSERLLALWDDRRAYPALSAGAVASAHERFHPDTARRRLEDIYERLA